MVDEFPSFSPLGDFAILVTLGDAIDLALNRQVHALARRLAGQPLAGLDESVPGYASLMVTYDPLRLDYAAVLTYLQEQSAFAQAQALPEPRRVEIPVQYGGEDGPDLDFVAQHAGLTPAGVVQRHVAGVYTVYFLGFTPGFAYLGGLDPALAAPRLPSPRTRIPAGSVGIAGSQTGIYPLDSPGGWRLIGRTTLRLFDPQADPPARLAPGDEVRFVPVGGLP